MLTESSLLEHLSLHDGHQTDKVLLCLAFEIHKTKTVKEIKAIGHAHGFRNINNLNISSILCRTKGKASRVKNGWVLTNLGKQHLADLGIKQSSVATLVSASLRTHLVDIKNLESRSFVEEAVFCFEAHQYRAAVVFSWVGAVSILYDHVIAHALTKFNTEGLRRNPKYRAAATRDDLARLKESDFLDYLEGSSVIGKSVRKELGNCLDFRNGCGHPNSLSIAETRVAAHIETLILNVYSKF